MRPVFPALWLSQRGVYALLAVAVAIAIASALPALLAVAALAGAAYLALLGADFLLGPRRGALRVTRAPVQYVALRRPAALRYRIENRGATWVRVGLYDAPVEAFTFEADSLQALLGPRSFEELEASFVPRERGVFHLRAVYVWAENAIGVLRRRYAVAAPQDVRVFPDLSAVEERGNLARRSTALRVGLRRLRLRGHGNEYESLREYLPGDAFRSIDWKATARRGRLMVEQYEVDRSQQVLVVLDAGRLMLPRIGLQRKFDYALTAGLSVARVAQLAGDRVGLFAFAAKPLVSLAPRRGAVHVDALARATLDLQPRAEEPDYETTFGELERRYTKRSLVILFTDMFDPVASGALLAGLGALIPRHLVMCVLMNDTAIARALAVIPKTPHDAYRTSVAMRLADERARALAVLRSRGILVVDVAAPKLTVALLDAYLEVKARGAL